MRKAMLVGFAMFAMLGVAVAATGTSVPTLAEFNALEAKVTALETRVAALEATPSPSPSPSPLPSPSSLASRFGWNLQDSRFGARRLYFTWANRANMEPQAQALAANGVYPLLSLKPPSGAPGGWQAVASGQYDAEIRAVTDDLPPADLAFHHEPEDDAPANGADFRAAFCRVAGLLEPQVRPVVNLMDWTFVPASGRNPAAWLPTCAEAIAVDPYNWWGVRTGAAWISPAQLMQPVTSWLAAHGDTRPLSVWETNSIEDPAAPSRKANWIRDWRTVLLSVPLERVVFFDNVPPQTLTFKLFSSAAATQAVAEVLTGT